MEPKEVRIGHWMRTFTGKKYWPMDPRPAEVCIEDIAHHLSMICRYNGASHKFYSVAEHSVLVSYLVPPSMAFYGLMHDAQEAYVGDMLRPLKVSMPEYRAAEDRNWYAVADKFNLPRDLPPEIKKADIAVLAVEKRALGLDFSHMDLDIPADAPNVQIQGLYPLEAEAMFLRRYNEVRWAV